ncbi:16S rRNA (uracil(1498)-N(3))-methyltransferase [Paenibacillus sp.]|uniref:16S rRNA (uracil(1498)-N(3))-methyltransferase n=1 Tax=Paenibacillus sp. TaxID=58172 RepID=UPI0028114D64|nr:16S rRNA (uracil(1498)-N(3))-methyltransferase [Paenibacillus sp.]
MQRYFVTPDNMLEDKAIVRGDDAHHLMRVMRAAPGDKVIVSDGANRECLAEVVELYKENVLLKLLEERPMEGEPKLDVWIAQSLPKGDKLETVIQKGTEIGATAFLPFASARTIVQYDAKKEAKRLDRWRKIAKEAAEQAHRSKVPDVRDAMRWSDVLSAAERAQLALLCYEKESGRQLKDALREAKLDPARGPVLVIVGPEGGFTEEEAAEAERRGCVAVSLGRRILRTETAGLVAAACILYESGEMGG